MRNTRKILLKMGRIKGANWEYEYRGTKRGGAGLGASFVIQRSIRHELTDWFNTNPTCALLKIITTSLRKTLVLHKKYSLKTKAETRHFYT